MDRTGIGLLLVCLLCVSTCVLGQNMVNVAPGKTYRQSTTYGAQGPSCNAANGNTGGFIFKNGVLNNCIHTRGNTYLYNGQQYTDYTPWWEVDLGMTYPVQDIKIWAHPSFPRRLYPFNITVDGQLCARVFDDGNRERSVRCSSVMYGQVVRLTKDYTDIKDNQYLILCELEVLVCQSGFHMLSNNTCVPCSTNCDSGCDRGNGRCDGCVDGYFGDNCARACTEINPGCATCSQDGRSCPTCKPGYKGSLCSYCVDGFSKHTTNTCTMCSPHCKGGNCDKVSGTCDNGCVDGWHGARCNTQCSTNLCQRCGQYTGQCEACTANLDPPSCTGCVDGRYGVRCDNQCTPSGCLRCGQNTGQCEACKANLNLAPPSCTECQAGSYKRFSSDPGCTRCTWTCYNNTPCDKSTGHCSKCPAGYTGNTCQQTCSDGWYGVNCTARCGSCDGGVACNKSTGHCPCPVGKQPPLCDTDCKDNTYGKDCLKSCGQCQGEQPCDTVTGECPADCLPGWMGTRCDEKCESGLYGAECNETCGHCQVGTTCHHEGGHCPAGCVANFTGPLCVQETKPETSQENKDDSATNLVGPLVGAIVGVGLLMTISITAAICWRRKSATSRSSGQDPPTASSISVKDSAPAASPEPPPLRQSSPNENNPYSEIPDPDDIYEISEMQSIYDKPSPYSNDDGDREPYMQLTSKANDVNMPASNAAYVNTKLSV